MKVTLSFPSYLHLSGFISVTEHADIEMDLGAKTLTADFNEMEILSATERFGANLVKTVPL